MPSAHRGRFLEFYLPFVGNAFEENQRKRAKSRGDGKQKVFACRREPRGDVSQRAKNRGKAVHHQDCAPMTESEIRKPVCGVVFSRRSEWQQAAAGARDGDERGVKNRDAQNQQRARARCPAIDPRAGEFSGRAAAIRNPRNIAPPSPMKIFAGLKFQRRKPRAAPSVAAAECADHRLAVQSLPKAQRKSRRLRRSPRRDRPCDRGC